MKIIKKVDIDFEADDVAREIGMKGDILGI